MERQLSHLETVRILCSVTDRFHTALCKRKSAIPAELLTTRLSAPHGCFPILLGYTLTGTGVWPFYFMHTHLYATARPHIRIMHSRLYGFLHTHIYRFAHAYIQICTRIYTDLHVHIYGNAHSTIRFSWRPDTVLFYPGRRHDLQFYRKMNKIFKNCNKTCIKAQNKLQRF